MQQVENPQNAPVTQDRMQDGAWWRLAAGLRDRLAATSHALSLRGRDHRVDALRGAALLMMFVDHIPQNLLNRFTMRNVGFADAAEGSVLLAGYASWLAYGRSFVTYRMRVTLGRLLRRSV